MLTEAIKVTKSAVAFTTKAETLYQLQTVITKAIVLPLYYFTIKAWVDNQVAIIAELEKRNWFQSDLVVRSSALGEDSEESSLAGKYHSVLDINGKSAFITAVEDVIASYDNNNANHQILVQPQLLDVVISGVAFGRDPNTDGPYYVINYNDKSNDTTAITAGQTNHQCFVVHQHACSQTESPMGSVCALIAELSQIYGTDYLDVEFAIDSKQQLYLFQVRPLIKQKFHLVTFEAHQKAIQRIEHRVSLGMKPHPYLYGQRTVYGVMPDWNPAEMIGVRPKPLALSLYKEMITDAVWAYQRDNYGYANLRSFPLLVDFEGLPYIDVRVSFNSFLPKQLPANLAERLVDYYLERLVSSPSSHDKVEFDIVFSCYMFDLQQRLTTLKQYDFSDEDISTLSNSLIQLTNQIIHNQQGLWKKDLAKIEELKKRQEFLFNSNLDPIVKMYWILEDCKRYGTLPFAGLARAGFIAIQILRSLVTVGIINEQEYMNFIASVNSVSSKMQQDFQQLDKAAFMKIYGHLRPGTYDILSPRYDEAADLYFDWNNKTHDPEIKTTAFSLSITQLRKIQELLDKDKLQVNVLELLEFIKIAIEAREYSKFVFTQSVSEFLRLIAKFAEQYGISKEDCAYINLKDILMLYSSSVDPEDILHKSIAIGKKHHQFTSAIMLPPLITQAEDVWQFVLPETLPNFITQKQATGPVAFADAQKQALKNSIVMIPSADPGYDWIFSHQIAGLITQYGGANSHMAIRAGELGIPAIIGAGELKYQEWSHAKKILIDCLNRQVTVL